MTVHTLAIPESRGPSPATDWVAVARDLAAEFKPGAVARDQANTAPAAEVKRLRESGLVNLFYPARYGGGGGSILEAARCVLELSKTDGSIGSLLAWHYYNAAVPMFLDFVGDNEAIIRRSIAHSWYWGNITQYVNKDFIAEPQDDGSFIVNGTKKWNTGAPLADVTTVLAVHANRKQFIYAYIPTDRAGVRFHGDWDQMGLRGADSSTVTFENVRIGPDEIIPWKHEGVQLSAIPYWTTFGAIFYSAVYLGLTFGALDNMRDLARNERRQVVFPGAANTAADPLIQTLYGELWIKAQAALGYFEMVIAELQEGWDARRTVDEDGRGLLAVKSLGLRCHTSEVAMAVTPRIFDFAGGRASGSANGFDRFWRDARMLSLHDPMLYSQRAVGDFGLNDKVVKFGSRFG